MIHEKRFEKLITFSLVALNKKFLSVDVPREYVETRANAKGSKHPFSVDSTMLVTFESDRISATGHAVRDALDDLDTFFHIYR